LKALTGWKDIANYLRRGVRTVQRWESIGLPIHRHGKSVIASAEEIDEWVKSRPARHVEVVTLTTRVAELQIEVETLKATIAKRYENVPTHFDKYGLAPRTNRSNIGGQGHGPAPESLLWSD
jgi:hypothetical protein